jgi:hypothetical protein
MGSAAIVGDFKFVKFLIEKGANVHENDDIALRNAAIIGNYDIIKLLL